MNFQSKKTMPRYFLVVLMLTLAGVSAVCKSVYIMTVERERWMTMGKIPVKLGRPLYAKRGNILAANGEILAASLPEYELRLDYMSSEKDTARSIPTRHGALQQHQRHLRGDAPDFPRHHPRKTQGALA